jgi:two-component system NarL family sensor kinase
MHVRATQKLLPVGSGVSPRLSVLSADLENCQRELRELVNQLGPPALDNGLRAGLFTECQRFTGQGLAVRLYVSGALDGLPAAVEVAVYRIVAEALANVARHAKAGECGVAVQRAGDLTVRITDDGVGLGGSHRPGVGLGSMRERAAELGGTCVIRSAAAGGTEVSIRIPLSGPVAT